MDDHRSGPEPSYGFGSFRLEPQARRLVCGDVPVALGPKLFDLLCLLAREEGRVVSRAQIVEALWPDVVVCETNLRQKVWLLRGLLRAADPTGRDHVETVPRRGYRLAASVTWEALSREVRPDAPAAEARVVPPPERTTAARAPSLHLAAVPLLLAVLVSAPHANVPAADPLVAAAPDARRSVTILRLMSHSSDEDGWLASAFTEMLRAELAAVQGLRLIPVEAVERVAAELSPPPGIGLSADRLVWVRNALGTDLVVAGSLVATGPGPDAHLRVDLLIQCTRSREVLAAVTRRGPRRDLTELASRTAREVRRALGVGRPGREPSSIG